MNYFYYKNYEIITSYQNKSQKYDIVTFIETTL